MNHTESSYADSFWNVLLFIIQEFGVISCTRSMYQFKWHGVKAFTPDLLHAGHIKSSLWATNLTHSPALFSCILNADEAVMILPIPKRCPRNHRSLLNHPGFMAQANPLCSDHRERHQRSGTNTLVWGALSLSCIVPGGWKRLKGEASASLWLRNTPVAPAPAWCRRWTVALGLPGPR